MLSKGKATFPGGVPALPAACSAALIGRGGEPTPRARQAVCPSACPAD